MKKIMKVINIILCILTIIFCILLSFNIIDLNIIPSKYFIIGVILLLIVIIINALLSFKCKHLWINIISSIIYIGIIIVSIFANNYIGNTNKFIKNTYVKEYETVLYSVVVLKDSEFNNIKDLNEKKIAYLQDDYNEDIKSKLEENITYEESTLTEFNLLSDLLMENKTDAIILQEEQYKLLEEQMSFKDNTKVIYTLEIRVKTYKEDKEKVNINEEPIIVYISGIDQYGNVNTVRGRSDVNMLFILNPKTNKILLVNTPRDYYVQLHGTTGIRDKLTHAGVYGIGMSVSTLEDLYGVDVNYYLRVNFNTVIKVVDVIGGIDINSDRNLVLDSKIKIDAGWNHLNGTEALRYARERHSYETGDRHRGENQQQVISAIISKVTQSKVLIGKYNQILESLAGSFQTDMPTDVLTSYIKYQLNSMPKWNIESISATGSDSSNYTYSMGSNYRLYVMEPDQQSVQSAKNKINEIINSN